MPQKRRKFIRPSGKLRYRKLFVIAAEGVKTERQYFDIFNNQHSVIHVNCLKSKNESSPPLVLKRMKKYLTEEGLKKTDQLWEAWLVVDKDQWTDEQLTLLHNWSISQSNYGFALSNPQFEYWLLLHFEDGTGIGSSRECFDRLNRYLPNYDKNIDIRKITPAMIDEAVRRARDRDVPPCEDWPRATGTTVYRLVERILETSDE